MKSKITADQPTVTITSHSGAIRELGMVTRGTGRFELTIPKDEHPTLKLFSVDGRTILSQNPGPGTSILDVGALRLPNGLFILRLQGKKLVQQKIMVSGNGN